jgi:hypothetical protein
LSCLSALVVSLPKPSSSPNKRLIAALASFSLWTNVSRKSVEGGFSGMIAASGVVFPAA